VQPAKLDTAVLCVRCHEANLSKPKEFPQVASADHSAGLPCNTCHQPHSPAIDTEPARAPAKGKVGGKK
jgi:transcription elongation factor Elf1